MYTRELNIAEASFVLMASFFVSALLGGIRQVLFNAQFGAGQEASAYYAAFRLPDTLFSLIAGGALSSAMIPVLLSTAREEGAAARARLGAAHREPAAGPAARGTGRVPLRSPHHDAQPHAPAGVCGVHEPGPDLSRDAGGDTVLRAARQKRRAGRLHHELDPGGAGVLRAGGHARDVLDAGGPAGQLAVPPHRTGDARDGPRSSAEADVCFERAPGVGVRFRSVFRDVGSRKRGPLRRRRPSDPAAGARTFDAGFQ
ncbi:MAG: hypothetical protein EHM39_06510 [Chloroflexi bacterium]|nr:MAG: hypothetical protein EHM39_06510 [Chloroflexota bacterium]